MGDSIASDVSSKKYDRQVRIWGAHGQAALEQCRVCCLGANVMGAEVLKNLVLGGISGFTLVDDAKVTPRDLGNNFLVELSNLGQPLAQVVTDSLKEFNDAVVGSYSEESPLEVLNNHPNFFKDFQLVVATKMHEADLVLVEEACRAEGVPLLAVQAYGLTGSLRISSKEHTVMESKPENIMEDLRLHEPWPELADFASSIDLTTADEHTHQHTPFAVILLRPSPNGQHA
eukprot:jgi/Botrbrau1/1721/Bobra.116_2s0063.1